MSDPQQTQTTASSFIQEGPRVGRIFDKLGRPGPSEYWVIKTVEDGNFIEGKWITKIEYESLGGKDQYTHCKTGSNAESASP
jgi:hypothetical protein